MTTMVRSRPTARRDADAGLHRNPVDGAPPSETFFRAGRIAAARDTTGSPARRAVSALIMWALVYGLLVAMAVGLGTTAA